MKNVRVGVVMVVQNDEETVERTIRAFYDHVEAIAVSTDPVAGWSGVKIIPDRTIEIIRSLDVDHKIDIIEGNFFVHSEPMKNDTNQRQLTADWLASKVPGLDWICQIDADEEYLDFRQVKDYLAKRSRRCRGVKWPMAQVFNILDDGRLLIITDKSGKISVASLYVAHRPFAKMVVCRLPAIVPFALGRQTLRLNEVLLRTNRFTQFFTTPAAESNLGALCLHHTFGKSEKRIREKLKTWGHAADFDTDAFLALWQRSKTHWEEIKDFFPLDPPVWPALSAMSHEELKTVLSAPLSEN